MNIKNWIFFLFERIITVSLYVNVSCFSAQLSNAINLKEIAEKTEGYSGSDLRELCRDAAMYRVRDYVRKEQMRQIAQQLEDCQEEEKYDSCSRTHKISQASCPLSISLFKDQETAPTLNMSRLGQRGLIMVISMMYTLVFTVKLSATLRNREF